MDDLVAEFLVETNESLDEPDADIITLEQNPNDQGLISQIFRLMHTIKGTCGFLGLPRLEKLAHHAENVLGRYRDGDLEVAHIPLAPPEVSGSLNLRGRIVTAIDLKKRLDLNDDGATSAEKNERGC